MRIPTIETKPKPKNNAKIPSGLANPNINNPNDSLI